MPAHEKATRIGRNLTLATKLHHHSSEWNGWIYQHNSHPSPQEITEENIQTEIDNVGRCSGMEIMKKYQSFSWVNDAMNKDWCEISIG